MIYDTASVCFLFPHSLCGEVIERVVQLSADGGSQLCAWYYIF